MGRVCKKMNRSRQSYYKAIKSERNAFSDSEALLKMIRPFRTLLPRLGGKKLHFLIREELDKKALKMGRDRFFKWLRANDLLIEPKKMYVHTTQSNHRFWVHDNLTHELTPDKPNQLWVSDITYIRTTKKFCYLALITDAFSRKIVGYDLSDSLSLDGCLRAVRMATQTAGDLSGLIHHSDRGFQYCSHPYTDFLKDREIKISMTKNGNCYENALAERVNGILKNEFNLDYTFNSKEQAMKTVNESIYLYNEHRPHWALNLQTPQQVHVA